MRSLASSLLAALALGCACDEARVDDAVAQPATPRERETPEPPSEPPIALTPAPDPAAEARRAAWLEASFRCRAISTTRLRACRVRVSGESVSLTFPIADLTCDKVMFDDRGDPSALRECASRWLRVPADIELTREPGSRTWSGATRGWRWRDGQPYCCPGVWIRAPDDLELDADQGEGSTRAETM